VTAGAGFAYLLLLAPLPPPTVQGETTFITDSTGARLATIDDGQNRVPVSLSQVPPVVVKAVLDTEDHGYYHHGALDPVGILRAAYDDLRGRPLQGGSTIAQQYVKQVYVGTERTFLRKLKEAAVAVRLHGRDFAQRAQPADILQVGVRQVGAMLEQQKVARHRPAFVLFAEPA